MKEPIHNSQFTSSLKQEIQIKTHPKWPSHFAHYHVVILPPCPYRKIDAKGAASHPSSNYTYSLAHMPLWFNRTIMEVWHGDEFNEPISQLEQKDKSRLKRSEEREKGVTHSATCISSQRARTIRGEESQGQESESKGMAKGKLIFWKARYSEMGQESRKERRQTWSNRAYKDIN